MRLGILLAVATLVLVTLVTAFPQVAATAIDGRSANTQDHMDFTRELAEHSAKLDTLKAQHDAMSSLPERITRIEERLDVVGKMIWAILAGIAALLSKEAVALARSIRRLAPASRNNGG